MKFCPRSAPAAWGEVYKAKDTRLDRTVAIKVLPEHLSRDAALRERFEREARTVSSLNHPHICTLYDVGQHDGVDYLVMEFIEGETLAERLKRGPLPLEQALAYGVQIADALDKAHREGIVHRDIKPGNVMLTKPGIKVLDFGLAKTREESVTPSGLAKAGDSEQPTQHKPLTDAGTILSTVQYMAPEQLEGKEVDARADLFSFGAVPLRDANRPQSVRGRKPGELDLGHHEHGAASRLLAPVVVASRTGPCRPELPRQRLRGALAQCA